MRCRLVLLASFLACALLLAPRAHAHGLVVADGEAPDRGPAIALDIHRVEVKVDGPVAHVTLEQTFLNRKAYSRTGKSFRC